MWTSSLTGFKLLILQAVCAISMESDGCMLYLQVRTGPGNAANLSSETNGGKPVGKQGNMDICGTYGDWPDSADS
jgi:hypothetical protein